MPNDRDYPVSIRVRTIGMAITVVAVVCGIYLLVQFARHLLGARQQLGQKAVAEGTPFGTAFARLR
jgi:hypothetical protein